MIENVLSIVIMAVLIVWVITEIILDKPQKNVFVICSVLIIFVVIAEMCCTFYENTMSDNRIKSLVGNLVGFSLTPFIFTLESYIYNKKHIFIKLIPAVINAFIVLLSSYTGWIFCVSENNIYTRGPLYFVFIIAFVYSIIISFIAKINTVRFLPGYFKLRTILSCIVMLAGLTIQVVFPKYHSTWLIICVFFVLDYAIICEINSMVDGLTGLLNKTVFNKQMRMFQLTKTTNYYIIMLDVNDFKKVNDTKGHLYGDKCLYEIATVLKNVFNKHDIIFRFGGDEFCVLLNAESSEILDQYIKTLKHNFVICKEKMKDFPDVALGYAKFEKNMLPSEIIDLADFNMYECKSEMKK